MADPTQANRDALLNTVKGFIPSNTPLGQSVEKAKIEEELKQKAIQDQIAVDESNNYVMQRQPVDLPAPARDFVDPEIPITTAAPAREVAQVEPVEVVTEPQQGMNLPSGDAAFDKLASEQDKMTKSLEDDFKAQSKIRQNRILKVEKELENLNSKPMAIDNSSLWSKASTGQKILLALGAVLSSASPQGAEAFRKGIETAVNNDLNAQFKAIEEGRAQKNSLLSQLKDMTGSEEAAAAAFKANLFQNLGQKLSLQAQRAQSSMQREIALKNYEVAKENVNLQKAKMVQAIQKQQEEGQIPGFEGSIKDPVAAREFRKTLTEVPLVEKEIKNLLDINNKFLGGALSTDARSSAKQSQNLLLGKLREAIVGPGTMSETDRDIMEDAIANPTEFFTLGSSNKIKLEKLQKAYRSKLESDAAAYGLRKQGVPSSFKGV